MADDHDEQRQAIQWAAREGDVTGLLIGLAASGELAKLERWIERQFFRLDDDDAHAVAGQAVDALVERIRTKPPLEDVFPYLYRAAKYIGIDYAKLRPRSVVPFDERLDGQLDEGVPMSDEEMEELQADVDARRQAQFAEVRRLIGRITLTQSKNVLNIIFEALEKGVYGLTNAEIADMLGIKKGYVATAKRRGFVRLVDIAKEEGALPFDFTLRDLELADEAEAVAAAEEEAE